MIRVGITGRNVFIGQHLYNSLGIYKEKYALTIFKRTYFEDADAMDMFVSNCDVIVHLAAINKHNDTDANARNVQMVKSIIESLKRTNNSCKIIFASSIHEGSETAFGLSKQQCRTLFEQWASSYNGCCTTLLIPNVFGPFGKPYYNSVVATFCYQLKNGEEPLIKNDSILKLIYVNELINFFISHIEMLDTKDELEKITIVSISHTHEISVSDLLKCLQNFKVIYTDNWQIPDFKNNFELNLFNTYRSYLKPENVYPVPFKKHSDDRGDFVEIIKFETGGQASYSITYPGVTRGNHFHLRKIERFAVIKGTALISLRKIGEEKVYQFELDGKNPSFVDMPVWYSHNIKNIGDDELLTIFWISEIYNPDSPDTYFEEV